jgi:hypothetical protein
MADPSPRSSDVTERELREAELSLTSQPPKDRPFAGFKAAAPVQPDALHSAEQDSATEQSNPDGDE